MSVFRQTIEVGDLTGTHFQSMDAIVDTGATFTVVPASILNDLGVVPHRQMRFRKPDGRTVERYIAQTVVRVQGEQGTNMVVFGDRDDPVVLGSNTLLGLLLEVSHEGDRLVPADGLLVGIRLVDE